MRNLKIRVFMMFLSIMDWIIAYMRIKIWKLYQPISYKLINLKVIHDREECIAYLRNAIEE